MAMWQTAKRGGGARAGLWKVLSVFLAAAVMGALIFSALAPVAFGDVTEWKKCISWYAKQDKNPEPGSKFTFEYYDKEANAFKKLENFEGTDDDNGYWQHSSSDVQIKPWQQTATDSFYAATALNADSDGKVTLSANNNDTWNKADGSDIIKGTVSDGQFMILQKSASGHRVLKDWVDIPAGQEAKIDPVDTYVKANDIVYFLFRSASDAQAVADFVPAVKYATGAEDTEGLYPQDWVELSEALGVQSEVVEQEVVEQDIGWFVKQSKQPWEGSYFTFEYYDTASKTFKQMEKYVPVDEENPGKNDNDGWQDESGKAAIMGWKQTADNTRYAAVAFNAASDGKVALTRGFTVKGAGADSQFMLLQKSAGGYRALQGWVNIPVGQTVTIPDVSTYVKAGDIVYYLYRSTKETIAVGDMIPKVKYEIGAADTEGLYPGEWVTLSAALSKSNPATGDTAPLGFAVAVALFAVAAAVVCLPRRGARRTGGK